LRKNIWIAPTILAVLVLGSSATAFYKSSDPVVVREGYYNFYHDATLVLASLGLVLLSISITMIVRRLGGS
jgi:hypothetical protein